MLPSRSLLACLERRGPDNVQIIQRVIARPQAGCSNDSKKPSIYLTFISTVLSLRSADVVVQPLVDDASGSLLCWNGEIWKVNARSVENNDAEEVFHLLLRAAETPGEISEEARTSYEVWLNCITSVISSLSGPYAFVFYDARNERIVYGRDILGRRSLVQRVRPHESLSMSSVCDGSVSEAWNEIEADGIYMLDLARCLKDTDRLHDRPGDKENDLPAVIHIPWSSTASCSGSMYSLVSK